MVALRLRTSAPAVLNSARQHSPARPEIRPVFGDIEGKLDVLRVECSKCLRRGRYGVAKQPDRQYGRNSNMMKWKEQLNGDCPKRDARLHERLRSDLPGPAQGAVTPWPRRARSMRAKARPRRAPVPAID
jgi:hypothetical protein